MQNLKNNTKNISRNFYAFTLAEVLITLSIVGVIAVVTIPTLIKNQQERKTVEAVKKAYSTLSAAYALAIRDHGSPTGWGLVAMGDDTGLATLNDIMSEHLSIMKNCGLGQGCFPDVNYLDLNNTARTNIDATITGYSKLILADGTLLVLRQLNGNCGSDWGDGLLNNVCGFMSVDINGFKDPNKYGADYFIFVFTLNGIVPSGSSMQTNYPFDPRCKLGGTSDSSWTNGGSCAAWVIYNENTDYLECTTLSWTGDRTCS